MCFSPVFWPHPLDSDDVDQSKRGLQQTLTEVMFLWDSRFVDSGEREACLQSLDPSGFAKTLFVGNESTPRERESHCLSSCSDKSRVRERRDTKSVGRFLSPFVDAVRP